MTVQRGKLRCLEPACFDERVLEAAMDKLGLDDADRTERTITLLQRKLRDGGLGLTAGGATSPAAYLASLAACHAEPSLAPHCDAATPLPSSSLLHGCVDDALQRVRRAAPGDAYQTEIEPLLPAIAGLFFARYSTNDPYTTSILHRSLNAKATSHIMQTAVGYLRLRQRQGGKRGWAHHKAITAKGACCWKTVRPEDPQLSLSDVEYALAARLSLDLHPFPAMCDSAAAVPLPAVRPHHSKGAPVAAR